MRAPISLFLLLLSLGLAAADAPTQAEWSPIEAMIQADDPGARAALARLMEGRAWSEGWVKLADLDRAAGDHAAAFAHARTAVKHLAGHADSAHARQIAADAHWLAIHAATRLGRNEVALQVFDAFGDRADPRGEVHFRAAEAALLAGEVDRAADLLGDAKRLVTAAGSSVPLGFRFLEGRIYEARAAAAEPGSEAAIAALEAAAATYRRALGGEPLPNAWFNLARMQRKLADQAPQRRAEWLAATAESLGRVLAIDQDDADARFELGLVRLKQGETVMAYNAFNTALKSYLADDSTAGTWMVATAYRGRGTALLQMAEVDPDNWSHEQALADLERARQLGEGSDDLYNNLLVAYLAMQRRAGGTDPELAAQIDTILVEHGDVIAPTNLALSFLHRAREALGSEDPSELEAAYVAAGNAVDLFRTALGAEEDPTTWSDGERERAALWRYLGHAFRLQAQLAAALGSEAGYENDASERMRQAYAAWRVAGGLGDLLAQQHYLGYAARDDAAIAYAAAWDLLGWKTLLSLDGWKQAIATYGASGRWRSPLHLALWGGVLVVLLALGLRAALRRPKVLAAGSRERRAPRSAAQPDAAASDRPADETFLPDTMRAPRARDQALTGEDQPGQRGGRIPEDASADESYLPSALPDKPRAAVSDVAKRLARERKDGGGGAPRPRRRR